VRQPIKVFILLLLTCFTFAGCRDEAIRIDSHFMGIWNGSDAVYTYHLSIDNRSEGYWEQDKGGKYKSAQGVARVKNGDLSIGLKSLEINQYPAQDSAGGWEMTLSGVVYQKQ
jgi:hypothetical protein